MSAFKSESDRRTKERELGTFNAAVKAFAKTDKPSSEQYAAFRAANATWRDFVLPKDMPKIYPTKGPGSSTQPYSHGSAMLRAASDQSIIPAPDHAGAVSRLV
jgi:hypothetical protein